MQLEYFCFLLLFLASCKVQADIFGDDTPTTEDPCDDFWYLIEHMCECDPSCGAEPPAQRPSTHKVGGKANSEGEPLGKYDVASADDVEFVEEEAEDESQMTRESKFEGDIAGLNENTIDQFVHEANALYKHFDALSNLQEDTHFDAIEWQKGVQYDLQQSAVRDPLAIWPKGRVPYTISDQFTQFGRSVIKTSMDEFHNNTCIKFVAKEDDDIDYLKIVSKSGCWSHVGKQWNQPQELSLGLGCVYKGVVMHELMHAVGFFHEQSRTDRDNYVEIIWDNVKVKNKHNFKNYGIDKIQSLGTKYDYGSIMHYRKNSFGIKGKQTIRPKKEGVDIGQRKGFSKTDIRDLKKLYKCNGCKNEREYCALSWIKSWCKYGLFQRNCKKTCKAC